MRTAEKISITLPPDMLRLIREAVEGGEYASTSEALRDAARAWHRRVVTAPTQDQAAVSASSQRPVASVVGA